MSKMNVFKKSKMVSVFLIYFYNNYINIITVYINITVQYKYAFLILDQLLLTLNIIS
jgi:hypothetical protein